MAKLGISPGSTNVSLPVFIQDATATDGSGLTGLVYNTAGLVCYYVRPGSNAAALALATQTVTGAHADGGFVEVDATNMPGVYRLDLSDAIVAAGVRSVVVMLRGAANMAPLLLEIDLGGVLTSAQADKLMRLAALSLNARSKLEGAAADMEVMDDDGITPLFTVTPTAAISLTAANFTQATLRIVQAGAFANYVHHTGDQISITAGTGVTAGTYAIDAKIDDDTIELGSSITGAANVSDNSVVGTISNNTIMVTVS